MKPETGGFYATAVTEALTFDLFALLLVSCWAGIDANSDNANMLRFSSTITWRVSMLTWAKYCTKWSWGWRDAIGSAGVKPQYRTHSGVDQTVALDDKSEDHRSRSSSSWGERECYSSSHKPVDSLDKKCSCKNRKKWSKGATNVHLSNKLINIFQTSGLSVYMKLFVY